MQGMVGFNPSKLGKIMGAKIAKKFPPPPPGTRRKLTTGYIEYYDGKRWHWEHRMVFEQYLGRELTENEVIHHRNGKKDDNNLENLQLLVKKNHCPRIETKHSEDIHRLLLEIKRLKEKRVTKKK